jgi:hypothetical protein
VRATGRVHAGRPAGAVPPGVVRLELMPVAYRPGVFAALLDGRVELARSRAPVFEAARALLAADADSAGGLEARHQGSAIVAVRATVGEAAASAIEESSRDGLRKVRWCAARHGRRRSGYAPPAGESRAAWPSMASGHGCALASPSLG